MGTGRINIFIRDGRCRPHPYSVWHVSIYDGHGEPLVYGGKTYTSMPTVNAHLEVDVPPGFYRIRADSDCDNWHTDNSIAIVRCDEEICVNLYSPTFWECASNFIPVLEVHAQMARIDPTTLHPTIDLIRKTMETVPPEERRYLRREELEQMTKVLAAPYAAAIKKHLEILAGPR